MPFLLRRTASATFGALVKRAVWVEGKKAEEKIMSGRSKKTMKAGSDVRWTYKSEQFYEMPFLFPGKTGVEYKAPWQRGPWVES